MRFTVYGLRLDHIPRPYTLYHNPYTACHRPYTTDQTQNVGDNSPNYTVHDTFYPLYSRRLIKP